MKHTQRSFQFDRMTALIKITTTIMIFVGMIFYCIIWFLSGFEPIQEEPNWYLFIKFKGDSILGLLYTFFIKRSSSDRIQNWKSS
jgi:hypothetical protein